MDDSPILYQSEDKSVTLIDIPRSIAAAQGIPECPSKRTIFSSEPLARPYPSNEPKTAKARAKVMGNVSSTELRLREEYGNLVKGALEKVLSEHQGSFCLPRKHAEGSPHRSSKKRKLNQDDTQESPVSTEADSSTIVGEKSNHPPPDEMLHTLATARNDKAAENYQIHLHSTDPESPEFLATFRPYDLITNPFPRSATLTITAPSAAATTDPTPKQYTHHLPPRSSLHLSDTTSPIHFHRSLALQALNTATPAPEPFKLILLDPPWPSRSVKRSHKTPGSTYATMPTIAKTRDMLLDLQLQSLLPRAESGEDAVVGVWVTNKLAAREVVLEDFFPSLGVELREEWVWGKVTESGELVGAVDGGWKLPWEVLLVGGRRGSGGSVRRRVLFAVPDLHSRKPCLKGLLEGLVGGDEGEGVRVLEVFARYAVAGWCSWGDECLKFNWEGHWVGD
ncbi:hypothetical protein MBLNU230_g1641t1 [Neophaeotheca triangularis]